MAFRPHTLLKRNANTGFFPVNIAIFLRTAFFGIPLVGVSEWFSESDLQIIKTFVWHYYEQALSSRYYLWYWITNLEKPCQQTFWFFYEGFILCFVAKLSWIFFFFLKKIYVFFTKYTLFAEKMFLYGKKVLYWKILLLKKTLFTEKNINENVKKYLIWEIYFYVENVCVTNKI